MAKWTVAPETASGNLIGRVEYGDTHNDYSYEVIQDTTDIRKQVIQDREDLLNPQKKQLGWRKAFTIPDIVAIDIWEKYGLDIHDPLFMHDPEKVKKLKYIMRTEYPHFLIST